jgi:type I restriction enzyme M protein
MNAVQDIVGKVWKLCDVLRDDGITFHQYVNELTYLLFLKMAEETGTERLLLAGCRWRDLAGKGGSPEEQYRFYLHMLDDLGTRGKGRVRQIFANPTTFLHHPESLNKLVKEIDSIDWHAVGREGLGDVYEGILQKNANEKKSGAGQYFTPRPLIDSIVNALQPQPGETIVDPAAGTSGFFISADAYIKRLAATLARAPQRKERFFGVELVRDTHRLALMNAMLHEIEGDIELGDSLAADGIALPIADVIITNPPFGNKKGAGRPMRKDLPFPTSNKQLAFLQLIYQSLRPGGRAGIVLPDNVLFEEGVGARVRADLMEKCNLHTILRLPTGIFYAHGVKTNVLFFTRGSGGTGNTKEVWVYDLRARLPTFGKRRPLSREHFAEFEKCYGQSPDGTGRRSDQGEEGRFRCFSREEIARRGENLNINWLADQKVGWDGSGEPSEVADLLRERMQVVMDEIEGLFALLEGDEVTG